MKQNSSHHSLNIVPSAWQVRPSLAQDWIRSPCAPGIGVRSLDMTWYIMIHHDTLAGRHQQMLKQNVWQAQENSILLSFHWPSPLNLLCKAAQVVQLSHLRGRTWPNALEGLAIVSCRFMSSHPPAVNNFTEAGMQKFSRNGAWGVHPSPSSHLRVAKLSEILRIALVVYVALGPMGNHEISMDFERQCHFLQTLWSQSLDKCWSQNKDLVQHPNASLYASAIHGFPPFFHTSGDRLASALAAASPPLDCATCGDSMAPIWT